MAKASATNVDFIYFMVKAGATNVDFIYFDRVKGARSFDETITIDYGGGRR